jgi:hypothetical protein
MLSAIRGKLTFSNAIAMAALFIVLGGTAFAAKVGVNQLKANAVTTGKIKKEAVVTGKLKQEAVSTAKLRNGAVTTAKAASSFVAPTASKLAVYAHIDPNGSVLAGSQGIAQANVTRPSTGFYCFTGLNPAPVGGLATIGYSGSGSAVTIQFDTGPGPVCPAGTQAFVNPRNSTTGTPENAAFYVDLY